VKDEGFLDSVELWII